MIKYIVKPINDIAENYDKLKENKTVTIFITTNKYRFLPTLRLGFDDVYKGEKGFIEDYHIKCIKSMIPILKFQDTIIVGCDVGISRSPAVASAIAHLLKDYSNRDKIQSMYKFYNRDIYNAIIGDYK